MPAPIICVLAVFLSEPLHAPHWPPCNASPSRPAAAAYARTVAVALRGWHAQLYARASVRTRRQILSAANLFVVQSNSIRFAVRPSIVPPVSSALCWWAPIGSHQFAGCRARLEWPRRAERKERPEEASLCWRPRNNSNNNSHCTCRRRERKVANGEASSGLMKELSLRGSIRDSIRFD